MRRLLRPIVAVFVVLLWVAGPFAMVLGNCAAMGDTCEAPCAVSPCLVAPVGAIVRFDLSALALIRPLSGNPLLQSDALEPPPKPTLLS